MILIKNGYVIDPASGFEDFADIVIEAGIIKKIGCVDEESEAFNGKTTCDDYEQVIDAKGMIVAPDWLIHTYISGILALHIRRILKQELRLRQQAALQRLCVWLIRSL